MGTKRLLWVKTDAMLPLDKGGKIRSFNMLRHIARKASVDYVCFASQTLGPDDRRQLESMFHGFYEVMPADPDRMNWKYMTNLALAHAVGKPFTLCNYQSRQMAAKIEELSRSNTYDALICDFLGPALNFAPELRRKTVLFQHNVEHVLWERQAQQEKRPWRKLVYAREYRLVKRFEDALCRDFRRVICVSDEDAGILRKRFGIPHVFSVDTGVDTDYFTLSNDPPIPNRIVFTGSMDWLPNIDAMAWFVEEIFPKARKAIPKAELSIVGRNPGPQIQQLSKKDPRIIVSGKVSDVRPWMAQGEVFIVPIRVGGGTRLKIYEAMAMGLPVISTTIGAEGLRYSHGENILIANRVEDFAMAVVDLLQDPERRLSIGRAARDFVVENYSWPRIADQFLQIALDGR
jgi:sugar transferase (PEP-CTERM/EpsH1 system associated)